MKIVQQSSSPKRSVSVMFSSIEFLQKPKYETKIRFYKQTY